MSILCRVGCKTLSRSINYWFALCMVDTVTATMLHGPHCLCEFYLLQYILHIGLWWVAVVTRSSVKSSKTRQSSRLSASSVTKDTSTMPEAAASKRHVSSKMERSARGRGRPPVEQRRCSARKKLRLCVGDFVYSQGRPTAHTTSFFDLSECFLTETEDTLNSQMLSVNIFSNLMYDIVMHWRPLLL